MKFLSRLTDDVAPAGAIEDAFGVAALCLMVLAGFAATSLT